MLVLGIALIGGFSKAFWDTVAAAIPSGLEWLNPLESGELYERALSVFTFIVYEGTAMWTATLNLVGAALVIALVAWLAVSAVRPRAFAAVAASLLAIVIALPSIGHAFEIRRSTGLVTLAAGETVDDTLLAAGETIAIDGNVNGDLLAFGRSVTVRGNVTGDLITGGETINVEGTVGGNVIGGGRGVSLLRARVGRNLYGFGRDVSVDAAAEVAGNALAFGEKIDINGRVGTDVKGFGANVTVSGAVEGDVEGFAGKVTLLPSARIGGNVTAHVDSMRRSRDRGRCRRRRQRRHAARRPRAAPQPLFDGRLLREPGRAARRAVPDRPALALAVPRAARRIVPERRWPSSKPAAWASRPP